MKVKRLSSERSRLILTLELAVVLPAAALVILSAIHLKSIQRDRAVEAAIQRDFFQFLSISEKQINRKAYDLVEDVRNEMPDPDRSCEGTFEKILAAHPYAAHIFIYNPDRGLMLVSQPERKNNPEFQSEHDRLDKMLSGWFGMEFDELQKRLARLDAKGTPYFDSDWTMRGDKHVYQTMELFNKTNSDGTGGVIAGVVLDGDYLRDRFFPEVLNHVMSHNDVEAQSERNPAVMVLHAKSESVPLATSKGWDGGEAEVEHNLEGAFPGLTLGIKLKGTTLEALGEHFVHTSFLILGALSLLLAGGLILTYRNVYKEVALARLKSDFVSNVSHELRTPLSLIRLYAETLEMGRLTNPEKRQEYYQIIRKESERLTALINNILDFSRIEAGRKEYEFRETDLRELVHNTLESYRYQIEQQGFTYEEKVDAVPPVRVDREAVARSLVNLVNNALKYSSDRKYLGIHLYRDNGSVKLEVIDHGIGIPPQEQGKIFEKFYRVGDPLVHNTKGSGLGLSLVRHIVQAHGGQVTVDSAPGRGSKFTIALPVNGERSRREELVASDT